VLSGIPGATFWRAIGVNIIASAIQIAIVFFFFSAAVAAG
jgi:hypothetical protein